MSRNEAVIILRVSSILDLFCSHRQPLALLYLAYPSRIGGAK